MSPEALFQGLDRVGAATGVALSGLAHRGELAALEAGAARDHLAGSLALGLLAAALLTLGGFALNLAFAAAIWHRDDRGLMLGLAALAQLLLAALTAGLALRRLRRWQPLAETRRQLREDCAALRSVVPAPHAASDVTP